MAATDGTTDAEQVENGKAADRPPLPPDHPGQEPEGAPSRREARRALAAAEGVSRENDRPAPGGPPDARAEDRPLERTDEPYEVKPPEIVRDYYPEIPPTAQDRYFVRDQLNPVPLFDGDPSRDQVIQGQVGDCGVVATIGAVAAHRPEAIRNAFEQIGEGTYEITLHEMAEATPGDPVARPAGRTRTFLVNDELPVRTDRSTRPPAGIDVESCGWPALMEKVIAAEDQTWDPPKKDDWDQAWTGWHKLSVDRDRAEAGLGPAPDEAPTGYNRLDIGSTAYERADLLTRLTGEEAEVRPIPGERQGEDALLGAFGNQLDAGKPVLVGTRNRRAATERLPDGIIAGHAYEVTKVENGRIHMRNPWGSDHPEPMTPETFWEYYRGYNPNGTRDGNYTTLK
ncbi:hypothetical protein [Actinoallomurus iriomotensis]|uniref:Calpain catalytic domain-containing protein n=1 Tax=Actinoallomurus iriomotensis TaxID=478107 RepID=A0A9W6W5F0_9ACTN|nr:hypothetical protein [Actinoallomurus iriomotensis]GLY91419.1 hypothetical protein Airi02_093480 [Actinoallomurus iriomotensis]